MAKKIIYTDQAPEPIGPYNQAVIIDHTLYASGQISIDPSSGDLITYEIQAETHQVMKNLDAVLKAAHMSFDDVLKTSVFIKNMDLFPQINEVYGSYFTPGNEPARETVQVARLPKDVNVEISLIAKK